MCELLVVNSLSLLIAVAALGVAGWIVISGQIGAEGMDGLFTVIICLLIALMFALAPLRELRRGALRDLVKRRSSKTPDQQKQSRAASGSSGA